MKKNIFFHKTVKIQIVEDSSNPSTAIRSPEGRAVEPSIWVSIDFGLMLKVGDKLIFDEEKPKWVKKWEDGDYLFCQVIQLTERTVGESISFEAKLLE